MTIYQWIIRAYDKTTGQRVEAWAEKDTYKRMKSEVRAAARQDLKNRGYNLAGLDIIIQYMGSAEI